MHLAVQNTINVFRNVPLTTETTRCRRLVRQTRADPIPTRKTGYALTAALAASGRPDNHARHNPWFSSHAMVRGTKSSDHHITILNSN